MKDPWTDPGVGIFGGLDIMKSFNRLMNGEDIVEFIKAPKIR